MLHGEALAHPAVVERSPRSPVRIPRRVPAPPRRPAARRLSARGSRHRSDRTATRDVHGPAGCVRSTTAWMIAWRISSGSLGDGSPARRLSRCSRSSSRSRMATVRSSALVSAHGVRSSSPSRPSSRAAVTTSPASGAAARPPYPPFSRMTANAIRFDTDAYGAKPTNHECDGAPSISAVPVLPATSSGCAISPRPVPDDDDLPHGVGEPARPGDVDHAHRLRIHGSRPSMTSRAGGNTPSPAIAAATRAIRNGVASDLALAIRRERQRVAQPFGRVAPRQADVEQRRRLAQPRGTETRAQLREVGVARVHEPAVERHAPVRHRVGHVIAHGTAPSRHDVADTAVVEAPAEQWLVGERRRAAQDGRGGHQLEGRPRRIDAVARTIEQAVSLVVARRSRQARAAR